MVVSRACPELDSGTSSALAKSACEVTPRACPQLDWGAVPLDVRPCGAGGVAVDAPVELKPTCFHPSPLAGVLSRQGHTGQVCSYTVKETSLSLDCDR